MPKKKNQKKSTKSRSKSSNEDNQAFKNETMSDPGTTVTSGAIGEQPYKIVYLIRHGQSEGQVSRKMGRKSNDLALLDCNLTKRGISEALHIPKLLDLLVGEEEIQLVLSSPLTRALHTALLGFPNHNIIVHYDLKESGSKIPENVPRGMDEVLADLEHIWSERDHDRVTLDVTSLKPDGWPYRYYPNMKQKDLIRHAFQFLFRERAENIIAVVCHYNMIRAAMVDGAQVRPANATPIRCRLYESGELVADK